MKNFRKTSPPWGPTLICDVFSRVYQIFRLGLEAALSPETESQNLNWLLLVRTTLFGSRNVRDINASGKLQVGILAIVMQFVVFTSFIIVFNDNMYT